MSTTDSQQFYRVTLDSLAEYDETGSEAPAPGGDGGPPGGGGAVAGTGTPATGYVFSFADGPPMQNLISNVVVKNASGSISVTGTVVAYAINGPTGGTVTISFDNSTFTSGYYTAQFTATNPQGATVTQPSSNYYTQP